MVGRTAVVAAACCCLAGTAGAFLVPGPYFHKATPAKTRSVEVAMSAPPTLEGVPAEPGLKVSFHCRRSFEVLKKHDLINRVPFSPGGDYLVQPS